MADTRALIVVFDALRPEFVTPEIGGLEMN